MNNVEIHNLSTSARRPVIRPATPDDQSAIGELLQVSYSRLMPTGYPPDTLAAALPLMTRANPALLSSGTYYLVEGEDGSALGCGGWTFEEPGSGVVVAGLAHIRHFATHPDALGQGVGRLIYSTCVAEALKDNISRFKCFSSLNATGFYAALGFERRNQINIKLGPDLDFPSVVMVADLHCDDRQVGGRNA